MIDRDTLRRRLLLCLFALGTNTGIKAIVATGEHGETETRVTPPPTAFHHPRQPGRAIARLASATFAAREPSWWGQDTACASDSKKFGSWESNLMTEWHQRYGGPGVMIYWHVERRSVFACDYLANSHLRREVHGGLEVVENWNSGNTVIFYGKDGDFTGPDREHAETWMLALHLLQSALVHVNTLLVQTVLETPEFHDRMDEDERRGLSPLFWTHINPTAVSGST